MSCRIEEHAVRNTATLLAPVDHRAEHAALTGLTTSNVAPLRYDSPAAGTTASALLGSAGERRALVLLPPT